MTIILNSMKIAQFILNFCVKKGLMTILLKMNITSLCLQYQITKAVNLRIPQS
jgi:hypothetical protein